MVVLNRIPGKTESGSGLAHWPARSLQSPTRAASTSAMSNGRFLGGSSEPYEVYSAVTCRA